MNRLLSRGWLLAQYGVVLHLALSLRLARSRPKRRMLRGARPKIVFLPPAPRSEIVTALRVYEWQDHLARRGLEIKVLDPCSSEEYASLWKEGRSRVFPSALLRRLYANLKVALEADAVVIHGGLLHFSPWQRPTLETLLARKNPRIVFDFFDALWVRRNQDRAMMRSVFRRWLTPADGLERVLESVAAVTVSNEYLADYVRKYNSNVHVLPMVLDVGRYPAKHHTAASPVVFGWMGNRRNLAQVSAILPSLREAALGRPLKLRVVCTAPFEADGLPFESVTHPWTPENEIADLVSFDVGLLPLTDGPYERGKSPLKLLQYAAVGLPIIASPTAVDPRVFVDGRSILFASTPGEWRSAIERLAADVKLRASLADGARAAVRQHYSFEHHADHFAEILRSVAEGAC